MYNIKTISLILLLLPVIALGQQQPDNAQNNQDEVVNIVVGGNNGPGDFKILRSEDKSEISNYISQVLELQNAKAVELLPHALRAVKAEKGSARVMKYTNPDTGSERHFLQIVTTEEQMESVIESLKALDLPGAISSTGVSRYSIRMRHRLASEVAQVLEGTVLSGEGKVYADDLTNTLFIQDSFSDGKSDYQLYEFYDVPVPQIEFDVQLIEVYETDLEKLGLDWQAWKRNLGGQLNATGNWFEGGATFARLDGLLSLDADVLANFLNYAVQNNHATIRQHTKITGSNLTPAETTMLVCIPNNYYERSNKSASILTEDNPRVDATGEGERHGGKRVVQISPSRQIDLNHQGILQESLHIAIQPFIGMDSVTANVFIRAVNQTGNDELDRPLLCEKEFSSVLTLLNEEPMHLSTIEREVEVTYRRGIPGLKKIPILKYLFSVEGKRTVKSQLYVVVQPNLSSVGVYQKYLQGEEGEVLKMHAPKISEHIRKQLLEEKE